MTLGREEIVTGLPAELEAFGGLVRGLDDDEWAAPTRCEGWSVADVSAHAIGSIADVVAGRFEGLGTPEVTAREVAEREGRSPVELADELAAAVPQVQMLLGLFDDEAWGSPAPGGYGGTLGQGVEAILYDTWAHAEDIRAALGREPDLGLGLRAGVHHLAHVLGNRGWGPATLALDGLEEIDIPAPADGDIAGAGAGRTITGDPLEFALAASGRADPAPLGLDESVNVYR